MAVNTTHINCYLLGLSPACTVNRLTFPALCIAALGLTCVQTAFVKDFFLFKTCVLNILQMNTDTTVQNSNLFFNVCNMDNCILW